MKFLEEEFKKHLLSKDKSINTIKTYSYGVQEFLNFYKKDLKELQLFEINEWRDELLGQNKSIRTIENRFEGLRSYIRFLAEKKDFRNDLVKIIDGKMKIEMPVIRYTIRDFYYKKELSLEEIRKIISAIEKFEKNEYRLERNVLLISLLWTTGLRVSEALSIKYKQLITGRIEVMGKRRKVRSVLIPGSIIKQAKKLEALKITESEYLFTTTTGRQIKRQTAFLFLRKYGKKAGIKERKLFPHNLRHSYTIDEIKQGVDLNSIADNLGIDDLETLKVYQQREESKVRERVNKKGRRIL